jgi:hypothetical protein
MQVDGALVPGFLACELPGSELVYESKCYLIYSYLRIIHAG